MRVGVGLPNVIPGARSEDLQEWAIRAESGPFTSIGALHRASWDVQDPLDALELVAAETRTATLVTMVAVAPLYAEDELADRAISIHGTSGGRLALGLAVGARLEDFEAAGVPAAGRGERFDDQLDDLAFRWRDGGPKVLVGGSADVAFARAARAGQGYVHGGGPPRAFARAAEKARAAWIEAERQGSPELWGQSYFAMGDERTVERGREYMRAYYAFTGPFAERIAEGLLTSPQAIAAQMRGYAEAGCDELVMIPALSDPEQVDRLAEAMR